ncbi:MAG: hypothetical protein JSS98_09390 [Bacteroidetes bacterium]|nr:hypothetical protein [Bacteroidota bacterium]MBS1736797.1 hypothetical protein [Bacteroidota bacterium]
MKKLLLILFILSATLYESCLKKPLEDTPPLIRPETPDTATRPIYYGEDTLESWQVMYTDAPGVEFGTVQFPTPQVGYVMDNQYLNIGRYRKTTDGGNTWSSVLLLPGEANNIRFYSDKIGFAFDDGWPDQVNSNVPLLMTNDGGLTWSNLYQSTEFGKTTISDIVFFSRDLAYASMHYSYFLTIRNIDNGSPTTVEVTSGVGSYSNTEIISSSFIDPDNGWALISDGPDFLNTADSGKNWINKYSLYYYSDPIFSRRCMFFSDLNHGWVSLGNKDIFRTIDGGKNWSRIANSKPDNSRFALGKMIFLDNQIGYGINANEILITKDGGNTWNRSCKNGKTSFEDIYYEKVSHTIWAVSGNRIFKLII